MDNEISTYTLPFSVSRQNALLGHLLVDESFFKMSYTKIKSTYFLSEVNSKIYELLCQFYKQSGFFPTRDELRDSMIIEILDPAQNGLIKAHITKNILAANTTRVEAIKPELTEWLHSVILMETLTTAQGLFNKQKIKECYNQITEATKKIANTSFDAGEDFKFGDYKSYLLKMTDERKEALTTGLSCLDKALLRGATDGGLQKGDTTIIMAPVNVGKTTCLITMGAANIKLGKDVLLMTHEGRKEDIRLKILSNMLECPIDEIDRFYLKDESRIKEVTERLDRHLKYIPYNKAGEMTIENVVPIIRRAQERWQALHEGKGFDLLISDYPAVLGTEQARKGGMAKREVDRIIYNNYIQLALEYGFHALLAIQTNREGSKINKRLGKDTTRLLEMEDVKESWDPMAEASNVITINRPPHAISKKYVIYNIAKCRSNTVDTAVYATSAYERNMTHGNFLANFSCSGSIPPDEVDIDNLFRQYNGKEIGSSEVAQNIIKKTTDRKVLSEAPSML